MPHLTEPFTALVAAGGELTPATSTISRRLSDMSGMYFDEEAERAAGAGGDPLLYEVFQYDVPAELGELFVCTTVLKPGKVGDEFFMTKGHFHEQRDRAEVYFGLTGQGVLLLQVEDRCEALEMGPGTVAYVPPHWGHRTVNTGAEPFVFLAVYPGDAGHDYGAIETTGFGKRVLEKDGAPVIVDREALA